MVEDVGTLTRAALLVLVLQRSLARVIGKLGTQRCGRSSTEEIVQHGIVGLVILSFLDRSCNVGAFPGLLSGEEIDSRSIGGHDGH